MANVTATKPSYVGVDLSKYQGDIPETGLEHLDFAYVQATDGGGIQNAYAVQQVGALRKQGVRVGYYHFVNMDSLLDQVTNFQRMTTALGPSTLPPALDCETADPAGWLALANNIMEFARQVEAWPSQAVSHTKAMIYANLNFASNLGGFPWGRYVWLADPNPGAPHRACTILQSAPRIVAPFPAAVDPDIFVGDEAAWESFTGVTSAWSTPTPPPTPAVTPQPPTGASMAVSQPVNYRPGQYDFFQITGGTLKHFFHQPAHQAATVWGEEDVKVAAGQGTGAWAPTLVGTPGVAVIGGVCVVTAEADSGDVFVYQQGATGNWAASEP